MVGASSLCLTVGVVVTVSSTLPFTACLWPLSLGEGVQITCTLPPPEVFEVTVTALFDVDEAVEFVRVALPLEDGFLLLLLL